MPRLSSEEPPLKLKLPQLRILTALAGGGALTRQKICAAAGFSELSGTITSALNGVREGSSSGAAHPGLIRLGLVEKTEIDLDGTIEAVYQITERGHEVLRAAGRELPETRSRELSTNRRYKENENA